MPYFMVRLSGSGISVPFEATEPAIGFCTTRLVQAADPVAAHAVAKELVLADWRSGVDYAARNKGRLPVLRVDESWRIGFLRTLFTRKPQGYSFYCHE